MVVRGAPVARLSADCPIEPRTLIIQLDEALARVGTQEQAIRQAMVDPVDPALAGLSVASRPTRKPPADPHWVALLARSVRSSPCSCAGAAVPPQVISCWQPRRPPLKRFVFFFFFFYLFLFFPPPPPDRVLALFFFFFFFFFSPPLEIPSDVDESRPKPHPSTLLVPRPLRRPALEQSAPGAADRAERRLLPRRSWPTCRRPLYRQGPADSHLRPRRPSQRRPTRREKLARLEGAEAGLICASGMGAIAAALLHLLGQGDHLLLADGVYGRTSSLVARQLPRWGIGHDVFDPSDAEAARVLLKPSTRAILVETLSNPLLRVADLPGLSAIAREAGIPLVVDNTFAPMICRPIEMGASLVMHSVTKLIPGAPHSDLGR